MTRTAPAETPPATPDPLEWPASPWECAAPESYLLLHFKRHEAKQALKLGVMELIARKRLLLVEVTRPRTFGRPRMDSALAAGVPTAHGPALPETLQPLMDVFESQKPLPLQRWVHPGDEPPAPFVMATYVSDYARAAVKHFGSMDGYVTKVLRPALEQRGWVHRERYRILGLIPTKRWALTEDGLAAQGDLLWRIEYGNRELGRLVDDHPTRAVAFLGLAGAAVLLMDEARPHLRRLRERLEAGTRDPAATAAATNGATPSYATEGTSYHSFEYGTPAALGPGALDPGVLDPDALDLGALDNAMGGLDFGALDSLDTAFNAMDAVDAGVASGAGDSGGGDGGGGDSGGGDGGGGGGE